MGDQSLSFSWTPGSGNGLPLDSQELQVATDAAFTTVVAAPSLAGDATTATATGLTNDILHYARIRGRHSVGAGGWSASTSGTPSGASAYNLATAGAMTPGNGISGYSAPSGDLGQFFDNLNPIWDSAPTFEELRLAPSSGWIRTIHVGPVATGSGDGLSASDKCTLETARNRYSAGTYVAGDWMLVYDGVHDYPYVFAGFDGRTGNASGTASNPIRMIGESLHGARIHRSVDPGGTDLLGWSSCDYWGVHNLELDGTGCTWVVNPGTRYYADPRTDDPNCSYFDFWHNYMHDPLQEIVHFGSSTDPAALPYSTDVHVHGNKLERSGRDILATTNLWGEGVYFGDGSGWNGTDDAGPDGQVNNTTVDWNHFLTIDGGEGVDHKGAPTGTKTVSNNLFESVFGGSQACITFKVGDIACEYNIFRDLHHASPGPAWGVFESGPIQAVGPGVVRYNVGWDGADVLVLHKTAPETGTLTISNNTAGRGLLADAGFPGDSLYRIVSGDPASSYPPTFSNNLSIDPAPSGATIAAVSDFLNAGSTGSLADVAGRVGAGYQLAASSAVAGTLGAMGKAT